MGDIDAEKLKDTCDDLYHEAKNTGKEIFEKATETIGSDPLFLKTKDAWTEKINAVKDGLLSSGRRRLRTHHTRYIFGSIIGLLFLLYLILAITTSRQQTTL